LGCTELPIRQKKSCSMCCAADIYMYGYNKRIHVSVGTHKHKRDSMNKIKCSICGKP
ncbi:120_t:CDS:1, partial [Cetraspora pellucida]